MTTPRKQIADILRTGGKFLIAAHSNPDGDAIGSTAAMGWLLKELGHEFRLYNTSGVPGPLDWLELPAPVLTELPSSEDFNPDWIIVLDSGDADRTGEELAAHIAAPEIRKKTLVMDHHLGNPMYGAVNWVDPEYPAVAEMVADLAIDLGAPLKGCLGEAVYLGIIADTGFFGYSSTRPNTHRIAAAIIEAGLDPGIIRAKYVNQWTLNRIRLWSDVMNRAEIIAGGRIGVLTIPLSALKETGTEVHDCDGLVETIRQVRGVEIAAVLREDAPGIVKISLRSETGGPNVRDIAALFNGGGHRNAAGGRIDGTIEEARHILINTLLTRYSGEQGGK